MKKILFFTTANLSSNPRLYKEINLARKLGYHVSFVAFRQGGWSDEKDQVVIKEIIAESFYLSALRSPYLPWLAGSLIHLLCQWVWPYFKKNLWISAMAHNKRTFHILNFLRKLDGSYDLVIAHNLGALYPAFVFAKKRNIPFAFDVEDYHPGESSASVVKGEVERRALLMSSLLPQAVYYSYASAMIGRYTSDLMPPNLFMRRLVVNNCFSQAEFTPPSMRAEKLKIVWFSQNINVGRGLEWVLPILDKFGHEIQLTLIGALNPAFHREYLEKRGYVEVVQPLAQRTLNHSLSNYDVGLALELNATDLNRQICLTNKIWAYLQAGLFILATDTPAQRIFMSEYPSHGLLVEQHNDSMSRALDEILLKKERIRRESHYRYENGQEASWEVEGEKLRKVWQEVVK